MNNLLDQFSPRLSGSYNFSEALSWNFNVGRFYQLPPYTTLGYKNQEGELVNKQNGLTYISADHLVTGFDWIPNIDSKLSLEGFFKYYQDYPFSVRDSVSISSKSSDFGTFGDEEVLSESTGRSYGLELLYRNKDLFGLNVILSYTLFKSEFKDNKGGYTPTSYDNRHLLNLTLRREIANNWEIGLKWRFVGGRPYTPYNVTKSELVNAFNARGQAYPDYSRFNEFRLAPFHQLDLRIDRQFFFDNWSFMLYVDVQNVYDFQSDEQDILVRKLNENGEPIITKGDDGKLRYELNRIESEGAGTILPTIGIIVEI